jgi:hypothetical protein
MSARDLIHNNEKLDGISVDKYIISDLFVTESIVYNYCKQRVNDTYEVCNIVFQRRGRAFSRGDTILYNNIAI